MVRLIEFGNAEKLITDIQYLEVQSDKYPPNRENWHSFLIAAILNYVAGRDEAAVKRTRMVSRALDDYFFGDWMQTELSGEMRDMPPNPEYWITDGVQIVARAECLAKCAGILSAGGLWEDMTRFGQHMIDLPWREATWDMKKPWHQVPGKARDEICWELLVAGVLAEMHLDEDLLPLTELASQSMKSRKHGLLFGWLEALCGDESDDEALQEAADNYFDYYWKSQRKSSSITDMVMLEGTFMVNLSKHRERPVTVPEKLKHYYIELSTL